MEVRQTRPGIPNKYVLNLTPSLSVFLSTWITITPVFSLRNEKYLSLFPPLLWTCHSLLLSFQWFLRDCLFFVLFLPLFLTFFYDDKFNTAFVWTKFSFLSKTSPHPFFSCGDNWWLWQFRKLRIQNEELRAMHNEITSELLSVQMECEELRLESSTLRGSPLPQKFPPFCNVSFVVIIPVISFLRLSHYPFCTRIFFLDHFSLILVSPSLTVCTGWSRRRGSGFEE